MIVLLMYVAGAGSSNESLLLNSKEFCELDVKPWNLDIGSIYTTEIDNHFTSGILSLRAGLPTHHCLLYLRVGELQRRWQAKNEGFLGKSEYT